MSQVLSQSACQSPVPAAGQFLIVDSQTEAVLHVALSSAEADRVATTIQRTANRTCRVQQVSLAAAEDPKPTLPENLVGEMIEHLQGDAGVVTGMEASGVEPASSKRYIVLNGSEIVARCATFGEATHRCGVLRADGRKDVEVGLLPDVQPDEFNVVTLRIDRPWQPANARDLPPTLSRGLSYEIARNMALDFNRESIKRKRCSWAVLVTQSKGRYAVATVNVPNRPCEHHRPECHMDLFDYDESLTRDEAFQLAGRFNNEQRKAGYCPKQWQVVVRPLRERVRRRPESADEARRETRRVLKHLIEDRKDEVEAAVHAAIKESNPEFARDLESEREDRLLESLLDILDLHWMAKELFATFPADVVRSEADDAEIEESLLVM